MGSVSSFDLEIIAIGSMIATPSKQQIPPLHYAPVGMTHVSSTADSGRQEVAETQIGGFASVAESELACSLQGDGG